MGPRRFLKATDRNEWQGVVHFLGRVRYEIKHFSKKPYRLAFWCVRKLCGAVGKKGFPDYANVGAWAGFAEIYSRWWEDLPGQRAH